MPRRARPEELGTAWKPTSRAEDVLARLSSRGVRITSEIIRYEGGNCFMLLDLDGLPTYVNEFPPDMVPPTDLGGHTKTAKAPSSDTRLGGHAIVYVSNMDAGVRFYSEKLGLPLIYRFEDKFAAVEAGNLSLAIHPRTSHTPEPGKKGSVALGLQVDEPMERVVSRLSERGVRMTSEAAVPEAGKRVEFEDEDGNPIYSVGGQSRCVPRGRTHVAAGLQDHLTLVMVFFTVSCFVFSTFETLVNTRFSRCICCWRLTSRRLQVLTHFLERARGEQQRGLDNRDGREDSRGHDADEGGMRSDEADVRRIGDLHTDLGKLKDELLLQRGLGPIATGLIQLVEDDSESSKSRSLFAAFPQTCPRRA